MRYSIFAAIPLFVLAGCGGGGGDDVAPERPQASVSGTGFDGLVINGDVSIYDFAGASPSSLIGTAKTNSNGEYSAQVQSKDTPIMIEVKGGYYVEEASGISIAVDRSLGLKLLAVDFYQSGSSVDVSATFFTTLATGLTEYLVHDQGLSTGVAIERAYAEIDAWAGFDTRRTTPVAVNDVANVTPMLTDGHRAGFVAAAISQLTRVIGEETGGGSVHSTFSSIGFIQKAYDDIRADGILDGKGDGGAQLSYGNLLMNAGTYRSLLSTRMLQFVNSDYNATGQGFDELVSYASHVNAYAGEVFNYTSAASILETYPTVASITVADLVKGNVPISADVSDVFGIESVKFYVDGELVGEAGANPTIHFDSTVLLNGNHELRLEVTNLLGNTSIDTRTIDVNNGEIAVTLSNKHRDDPYCGIEARLEDSTGLGLESITLNNWFDIPVSFPANSNVLNLSLNFSASCHSLTIKDHINPAQTYHIRSNVIDKDCKEWKSVPGPFGNIQSCVEWDTYCSYSFASGC